MKAKEFLRKKLWWNDENNLLKVTPYEIMEWMEEYHQEQLRIGGVVNCVYVVTFNDDYGRPVFDNCFNELDIAKEYISNNNFLRLDETTTIKMVEFE